MHLLPLLLLWLGMMAPGEELHDDPLQGHFVYLRSGAPIVLQASPLYAAAVATERFGHKGALTPPDGLELDPRGDRPDLVERGVTLYRVPNSLAPRGVDAPAPDAWQVARSSGLPVQPVFEHGAALRIPSNEVILGFPPETTLEEARRLLSEVWEGLQARQLWELRPGTFVCVLRDASVGRAFQVSRKLTEVEGVVWSEPSFINIHLETPGGPPVGRTQISFPPSLTHQQRLESKYLSRLLSTVEREPEGGVWKLMIDGHFENDVDKWFVARDEGSNRILPVVVRGRTHEGKSSVYMTGKGLAGNATTDPYLEGASTYLISPIFNLSSYRDVFVELWFWARFEDPIDAPRQIRDFGRVLLWDVASNEYVLEHPIVPVGPTGDLSRGPGTVSGWRKLMFRVPLVKLANPLQVHVHFYSDATGGADGMFVDDIRVLYSSGDGGDPFSRDPAAGQQYELMPRGQIASRPTSGDPKAKAAAAWSVGVPKKKDVIVALLDDGVERNHPDLAFWEPVEDEEGESKFAIRVSGDAVMPEAFPPGEPVSPQDRHGTACAGVLGAVANNGIGIAGVAPGALLLPLHRGIDDLSIVYAIDTAVEIGAHVLVIPWGWSGAAPEVITRTITDAIDAGLTVVAAAGDGVHRPYSDAVNYPCVLSASTSLICVGASSIAGEVKGPASADGLYWWRSMEDPMGPDLLAPGTWLHATDRQGPLGYNDGSQNVPSDFTDEFAGTGASACYVGGVAALMVSHDPLLQPVELRDLITTTARRIPSNSGRRNETRLVQPTAAARAAIESAAARVKESETPEAPPGD